MYRTVVTVLLLTAFIFGCQNKEKGNIPKDALFELISSKESGIDFINKIENEKKFNIFTYRNFYNGGGVGIADINNDGLADIYLISNKEKNKLYLNQGNFTFSDITEKAGVGGNHEWSTGVAMVDINADGFLDIYVCNAGNVEGDNRENELFINNGDLTFTEKASEYGIADDGFTTHASFFDYDQDGDLDVYILNNSFIPVNSLGYSNKRNVRSMNWEMPEIFQGGGDKLMRNDNGKFIDVSEEAGIYGSLIGFGMGVTVGDVNSDLLPDIYISNDFYERDYLYVNQGDGTFKESIKDWISHLSMSSMGADMADINNDGLPEFFVTDMLPEGDERLKNTTEFERYDTYNLKQELGFYHQYLQNSLQLNNGNGTFSEIAFYSGVAQTDWSWGALLFDMDNDGFRDIYVSNGIYHDLTNMDFMDFFANEIVQEMTLTGKKEEVENIINRMPSTPIPNYALKNNGNLTFSNVTKKWGFEIPSFSNGSAYGDLDNDGDLDLVVNNVNQTGFVFKNRSNEINANHFIAVKLKGEAQNTYGIGSAVYIYKNNQTLMQEQFPTRGFQSSVDYRLHFGLGDAGKADSVVVLWPNGKKQVLKDIEAGQTLVFDIKDAVDSCKMEIPSPNSQNNYFEEVETPFYEHKENFYIDFDYEGLIPQMSSREGPVIKVADINGDGLDDVFIGGATGFSAQLWKQNRSGKFSLVSNNEFEKEKDFEDTAAAFFDADGDGDADLYVGSGGNDKPDNAALLADRLYINDGKGNFSKSNNQVPEIRYNTSVVRENDFDNDGDIDLFVGNLGVSRIYGINPKQYLLENDGQGNFSDVTESKAFKLLDLGMVTDAIWHDINNDSVKELVIVGQWMSPKIFTTNGRRLSEMKTNLDSLSGWWNAVKAVDLDNDGDVDLVLGNRGENFHYKTSPEAPAKMFINDFDNNGTIEQILTRNIAGKDKPIPLKKELTTQIVSLKKKNQNYAEYAKKSIQEILPAEILENSIVKKSSYAESVVAYQESNGNFSIKALPPSVQFSCVNEILTDDINDDGYPDLLLGGNSFDFKPQFGRLDAGFFNLVPGNQTGFNKPVQSGIHGNGVVRSLNLIKIKDQKHLMIGVNNEKPQVYIIK